MISIQDELARRVRDAISAIGADGDPLIMPSADERHGDYQSNCAMGLAKRLGRKPRDVATAIVDALAVDDISESPEIAGPGFINFRLRPDYLARTLSEIAPAADRLGGRLGIAAVTSPEVVVIDISSPNLAKEMHVGHLRSTVIGDSIARILEFQGHTVIRENHVGDWGTQFGMLVAYVRRTHPGVMERPDDLIIQDLEGFYVQAKSLFDSDPAFKKESQERVVLLQQGDEETRRIWQAFCHESLRHCHEIYRRLDVSLIDRGESFYEHLMPDVIARLERAGLATGSEGAVVVFLDGFTTREGEPLPLMVRKSDGGYNYATSDLATLVHRVESLGARRIIYVVGAAQKLHFEMVFAAARRAGWAEGVRLEHLGFGNMLGPSGKPFKTREGGTVKLKGLLDQAVARARRVVEGGADADGSGETDVPGDAGATGAPGAPGAPPRRSFTPEQMDNIAETVGIAAVKYFDLSHGMGSDYKFDLDTMLSLDGNTAPYMLYAYARIRSIGRKAGVDLDLLPPGTIVLEHPTEIALAKAISRFAEVIAQVGRDLKPNLLTDYLYTLSRTFSRFYDRRMGVRVIDAESAALRESRLRLCDLTSRTLRLGLSLLGIRTLEEM